MKGYEDVLERDVFPILGDIPAADITAEQIVGVLAPIEDRSKSLAHRARSALGSTYRFGLKRRLVKANPTAGLGFIHVLEASQARVEGQRSPRNLGGT